MRQYVNSTVQVFGITLVGTEREITLKNEGITECVGRISTGNLKFKTQS